MKALPVILSVTVLGLSIGAWYYAAQQQDIMNMAVKVSGGNSAQDGMSAVQREARSQSDEASVAASEAAKKTREKYIALNGAGQAIEKREAAERQRDENISYRDGMAAELESTKERHADAQKRADEMLATMRELEDLSAVADLSEAVETFQDVVKNAKEKKEELVPELESLVTAREAATKKVADETTELARLDKINRDFEANYRKNAQEYVVRVVDPARNIIIFTAAKDSGLVAGDTTPLIVKRNKTTIATLRVESIKNNEVVAKYTVAPGQKIRVGDNIIHEKPHGS
ncbi:MAG: hypothetical protein IKV92_02310 [Akkermansia sp.]|nr:hypothetical protein [Akkermansia sp.]MBR5876494.1 hypothetical protein [Akkermansia sp.]